MMTRLIAASVHGTALLFKAVCAWWVLAASWTGATYIRVTGMHFTSGSFGFCPGAQYGSGCDDVSGASDDAGI